MANREAVFAVLDVMRKYYKAEGLSHKEIADLLFNEYDVQFKREKFAAIVDQINSSEDYEIIHTDGRYARYWLRPRFALTSTEAMLICALIADTDVLSRLEADELTEKICRTFYTSFDAENKIAELKKECRSGKNEINGIEKLELINQAIGKDKDNGFMLSFKIYHNGVFSDRKKAAPLKWYSKNGEIFVDFKEGTYKLAEMIDVKREEK